MDLKIISKPASANRLSLKIYKPNDKFVQESKVEPFYSYLKENKTLKRELRSKEGKNLNFPKIKDRKSTIKNMVNECLTLIDVRTNGVDFKEYGKFKLKKKGNKE